MPILRSKLDRANRDLISGWAFETDTPDVPVALLVTANGKLLARVIARGWRADLEAAGIGNGRHAFHLNPGTALSAPVRHLVAVQRESDGAHVEGSPAVVEAQAAFDDAARAAVSDWLMAVADTADLEERVRFLQATISGLLQQRSDRVSRRWDRLAHRFATRDPAAAADRPARRALVIGEAMPREGALLSHMESLRRLGFEVVFAPADMEPEPAIPQSACTAVSAAPWYSCIEDVLSREQAMFDLIYLHRISIGARYLPLARHYQRDGRVVFGVGALSYLALERRARVEDRPEFSAVSHSRRAGELAVAMGADAVLTHSRFERSMLVHAGLPPAKIFCVRWAVRQRPVAVDWASRRGLAFIGNFAEAQDEDAAIWLVEAIMPIIWATDPAMMCVLAGAGFTERIRSLAQPGVEVHDGDVDAVFGRVRLSVAPLRFGAGVTAAVVDSLAAGVPCVCSSVAREGLDLPASCGPACDDVEAVAARCVALHADEALNREVALAGFAYVSEQFSQKQLDEALGKIVLF